MTDEEYGRAFASILIVAALLAYVLGGSGLLIAVLLGNAVRFARRAVKARRRRTRAPHEHGPRVNPPWGQR